MEKEQVIKLIAGRIRDEKNKHPNLDWEEIAATKIYEQWFEYYQNEIILLNAKIRLMNKDVNKNC